jgi:hypothetical protein
MGADTQALCPYCSTLFIYDARLAPDETDPKGCIVHGLEAAGAGAGQASGGER